MLDDDILTTQEAAQLAKVCSKTMYTWTKIEGFPALKIGNCIRIPRRLFLAWVEAQAQKEGVTTQ